MFPHETLRNRSRVPDRGSGSSTATELAGLRFRSRSRLPAARRRPSPAATDSACRQGSTHPRPPRPREPRRIRRCARKWMNRARAREPKEKSPRLPARVLHAARPKALRGACEALPPGGRRLGNHLEARSASSGWQIYTGSTELTSKCSEVSERRSSCSCEVPERTDGRSGLGKLIGPRSGPVQMPSFWVYAPGNVRP